MKRLSGKQMLLYLGGILVCRFSWLGCFPLIPAYFTSVYLEESTRGLLSLTMLAGLALFVPMESAVKYLMAMLVIIITIQLFEWVEGRCTTICAAVSAALAVFMLSAAGELFQMKGLGGWLAAFLEGAFVFAAVMLGTRLVDLFLQMDWFPDQEETSAYQAQRLENYADSFTGLAKVFSEMSSVKKELSPDQMGRLQTEVTGSLCVNCSHCNVCWEREESPMNSYLAYMLQSLQRTGEPDREILVQMQEYCPYTDEVVREALRVFEKARLNLAWYNRLLENREMIAQQLDAMAYIMEDCTSEIIDVTRANKKLLAEVKYRAKERGILVKDLRLYETKEKRLQLCCQARARYRNSVNIRDLTKAVSAGLERGMRPHRDERIIISPQGASLTFEEDTYYHEMHGVARRVKDGQMVSGDNYSFLEMENGQMILMLSDGMGSGSVACRESELVLELLEKFLEAGFSKETALKMMNSAMVIRGEDDLYSTVDICSVDLYTGLCQMYKVGAVTTFIKRREFVERIVSGSLPVGVSHRMEIWNTAKELEEGDFIVMVTDGVLEALPEKDGEIAFCEIIKKLPLQNPGQMADCILEEVLDLSQGQAGDDMTVLVLGIWKK